MHTRTPTITSLLSITLLLATACGGKQQEDQKSEDDMVDVFKDGAMQRVSFSKLKPRVPAESKSSPDLLGPKADAIVGWYDSGHNYHAEKMDGKGIGDDKVLTDKTAERGVDLKVQVEKVSIFRNDVEEKIDFAQLQAQYSDRLNPGGLAADAIVGWYDSGHNYHAEKMG
ncbi:MAG: hypothetical protein KC636_04035, partial [Myxococcales bacterium]|nr:hypothetical protein [Myxococcales bacterium]